MLIARVRLNEAIRLECLVAADCQPRKNAWAVVQCARHEDLGRVLSVHEYAQAPSAEEIPTVCRLATLAEQAKGSENSQRSREFHRQAVERIRFHALPMRLVSTHVALDRSVVIFAFTAPGRVDFRQLLRDLTRVVGARVELRQIGPRDQAGMVGGIGSCGRALCCSTFLTNFVSINVKMAKAQGLSLNPSSIIGACGRLKCCLSFEYEGYRDLLKALPRPGTKCRCDGCDGKVLDSNPLTQSVKVVLADNRVVQVPVAELEWQEG
jgi:cell fate regulator YaaT (PSP1 superfamily)